MRTLTCTSPGIFHFSDEPWPMAKPGYALIRILRVGVCGTDLHGYEGTQPYFQYPRILGHELSGEVVDPGGDDRFSIGEWVTILPYYSCGHCHACKQGKTNCCERISVCGVHEDGGMREYFQVPVTALVKSQGLGLDALALVEPLAVAAHGIRRASIMAGETVLIVGAGPIGIGLILFAKKAGARVIVLEKHAKRSAFCKKELDVHAVLDPSQQNTQELIYEMTEGAMPDVVIDATGNLQALENSFRFISHGGRYVLVGLQKGEIRFSHPEFHKRESTLMSSRNATRKDFENVIGSIADGTTNPMSMMTHRIPFQETPSAFPALLQPDSECIKAMIVF